MVMLVRIVGVILIIAVLIAFSALFIFSEKDIAIKHCVDTFLAVLRFSSSNTTFSHSPERQIGINEMDNRFINATGS